MRVLSKQEADSMLSVLGLRVGNWNELSDLSRTPLRKAHHPSRDASELYVLAKRLLTWLPSGKWVLLQVDNSTCPLEDEVKVFEQIAFASARPWDIDTEKSFLFDNVLPERSGRGPATLELLIFFSLLFEWHVHVTSEQSLEGERLALQDGEVYFVGDEKAIEAADELLQSLLRNPLGLG